MSKKVKNAPKAENIVVLAMPGIVFPVVYQGRIVKIRGDEPKSFKIAELAYDSVSAIYQAIEKKELKEVGAQS